MRAGRPAGRAGQPDVSRGPDRADAGPAGSGPRPRPGGHRAGANHRQGRAGRAARARRRPVRCRVLPAHLRNHRTAEVLHPDPRLLPPDGRRHGGRARPDPGRPGARAAAAVPHQPDGLRHRHRAAHRRRRPHDAEVLRPPVLAVSGIRAGHRADPARTAGGDPQAGHHRRRRGRPPGAHHVLRRRRVPGPVRRPGRGSGYGSTEAGGISHLPAGRPPRTSRPTPAGTAARAAPTSSGGSTRTARSSSGNASTRRCSTVTSPPAGSTAPATPAAGSTPATSAAPTDRTTWSSWSAAPSRSG